ncbi:hypothetical protein Bca52824_085281 [Brassica carinata]|uniref:Phorbol-ester/DAG-type domain-containing protein n=1 Tax=Brassica carinata TaxID=52824 RepID=A0A8X7P7U7_BRACI|nr:hypothetical protein Bca52824_085281 [Brassica carinata]
MAMIRNDTHFWSPAHSDGLSESDLSKIHDTIKKRNLYHIPRLNFCCDCLERIEDDDFRSGCNSCGKQWHLRCIPSSPAVINHPFHAYHPLELLIDVPPEHSKGKCDACKEELKSYFYHCSLCNFSMHVRCSRNPPPPKVKTSKCHERELFCMDPALMYARYHRPVQGEKAEKIELVHNNRITRPNCATCGSRCLRPLILKLKLVNTYERAADRAKTVHSSEYYWKSCIIKAFMVYPLVLRLCLPMGGSGTHVRKIPPSRPGEKAEKIELVHNNRITRPNCATCGSRCLRPLILKLKLVNTYEFHGLSSCIASLSSYGGLLAQVAVYP